MKFIGRKMELEKLNAEYERDGGFVVIYGRRRVGKTTLIKEFLKKKTAFYFLATEELESQSMKRLAGVVARMTKNSLLQIGLICFRLLLIMSLTRKKCWSLTSFSIL